MSERVGTAVVGAGISGLAYAHFLGDGADVRVLERSSRRGGLIRTVARVEPVPFRYEAGPEALANAGEVRRLAGELGLVLDDAPSCAGKRYVVLRGKLVEIPSSPPRLFVSSLLTWRAKLRLFSEPLRSRAHALDGSIADFVRHRLGEEVLQALIDPLIAGIHASDPALLSMRACFPSVVAMVEEHGSLFAALGSRGPGTPRPWPTKPRGGMQALPEALARSLGDRLLTSTEVRRLSAGAGGWCVETSDAPLIAECVVLALPLDATVRLLADVAPEASDALARVRCESLASVVELHHRGAVEHPLDGFGYLVPRREDRLHLATIFCSSIDPSCVPAGFVLLRTLLGGARHPELAGKADAVLSRVVRDEVHPLLEIRGPALWSAVERHAAALPRLSLGHPDAVARLQRGLPEGLVVLGNFTRGIGIATLLAEARRTAQDRRTSNLAESAYALGGTSAEPSEG